MSDTNQQTQLVFKKHIELVGKIIEKPGINISELGRLTHRDKSTISKNVEELEKFNIVITRTRGKEKLCEVGTAWTEKYQCYMAVSSALDDDLENKIKEFVVDYKKKHNDKNPKPEEIGVAVGRNPKDSTFLAMLYFIAEKIKWHDPTQEEIVNALRGTYPDLVRVD